MAFYDALYDTHKIRKGIYSYLPKGKFAMVKKPVAGAVAQFEMGDDFGSRSTLGRVAAGAIIAGPVGAIMGGMFKKDSTRVYVTITFADGDVVVVDAPRKKGATLQAFARDVNAAGVRYAAQEGVDESNA